MNPYKLFGVIKELTVPVVAKDARKYVAKVSLDKAEDMHSITMHHNGKEVGSMEWNTKAEPGIPKGQVMNVEVYPDHQRNGLATHMWEIAQKASKENNRVAPVHSEHQSPEGKAWAMALGRMVGK